MQINTVENITGLVSIIMPAKNASKYIEEAIESVLNQDYKKWELLIIDDDSSDDTVCQVEHLVEKDSRIKLFHNEGDGVSSARNHGIKNANGEYISFLDSDDTYIIGSLNKRVNYLNDNNTAKAVFGKSMLTDGDLKPLGWEIGISKDIDYHDMYRCPFHINTLLCRSEYIKKIRFSEEESVRSAEDWLFLVNLMRSGISCEFIGGVHATYRLHYGSTVRQKFTAHQIAMENVINYIYSDCDSSKKIDVKFKKGLTQPEKKLMTLKIRYAAIIMALINDDTADAKKIASTFEPKSWNNVRFEEILNIIKLTTIRGYLCNEKKWLDYFMEFKEKLRVFNRDYFPDNRFHNMPSDLPEKIEIYERSNVLKLKSKMNMLKHKGKKLVLQFILLAR